MGLRVAASLALILYVCVGIYHGLANQRLRASPGEHLDCDYRVELTRDRLTSLIEWAHRVGDVQADKATEKFSTLLRDTQTRCVAADPETRDRIDTIERIFAEYEERRGRDRDARETLLAL
ncbi:MAG: hypothetical protein H6713_31080 [Myxococcales bacterium]|nr:hypothetical protein [Myxococcales bacterium]MCB9754407.1 hypothetical protein [Myxococcales bacterium]